MQDKTKFLIELKELLSKYNVSIGFSVSDYSDIYGIYGERMVIKHRIKGYKGEEIFSVDGWSINEEDIT